MDFYATWGEACRDGHTLEQLFQAGMTGLRVNLSHVSLSRCAPALLREFRPAARRAGQPEAHLILDLQGPELRVGDLPRPVPLTPGPGQESVWDYPRPPRVEPSAAPVQSAPRQARAAAQPGQGRRRGRGGQARAEGRTII